MSEPVEFRADNDDTPAALQGAASSQPASIPSASPAPSADAQSVAQGTAATDETAALRALLELSRHLLAAQTLAQVEETLVERLPAMLDADYAIFLRYEAALDALRVTHLRGVSWVPDEFRLWRGQGLTWQAAQTRQVICIPRDAIPKHAVRPVKDFPEYSLLFAPLFDHHQNLLGVVTLGREQPDFNAADLIRFEAYASTAVIALERACQMQRVTEMREGAMLALGLALEARDYETKGHTGRTVAMASQLGQAMNLPDEQLHDLRQGAYLHDIGKLSVPDRVLLKEGALSTQEWELMRRHTLTGEQLARRVPSVTPGALQVIRSHHERWDGRGYPDALRGEQIPLLARVFAVVDVFDALTHERPYHRPSLLTDTLHFLQMQAGRHFDPGVVDTFISTVVPKLNVELSGLNASPISS